MTIKEAMKFLDCGRKTLYRYMDSGELPYEKIGSKRRFNKNDLLKIASKIQENRDLKRPELSGLPPKPKETLLTKQEELKALIKSPSEELLNDEGKSILMEATNFLKENNLLDATNKMTLMRYALACQIESIYLATALDNHLKEFHDLANIYSRKIQHYEKELGLTPAALIKMKGKMEEPIEIDPMEELLNG